MVYMGTVRGGMVVLQPGADLPDGLDVTVEPLRAHSTPAGNPATFSSMRNGVPVFPQQGKKVAADLEFVNQLRDEAM